MKRTIIFVFVIATFSVDKAAAQADECPKTGASAWCCGLQEPAPAPSNQNYRWHADSQLCEGLISPLQSATVLNLAGFIAKPVPTDRQLQDSTGRVQIILPQLPKSLAGALRFRGMSLSGGRYFLAGDFTDRRPKSWDVSQFRRNASMLNFDFLLYRPADAATERQQVYMPVRLVLPGSQAAQGSASRIRFLSGRPLADARATYLPLSAELKLDGAPSEAKLDTKVVSVDLVEVTIPDGMPAASRLLLRACSISEQSCDVAKASPVSFDIVLAQ
jgi:hypothetical protein